MSRLVISMASSDIYQSTFDEDVPTTTSAETSTCPKCDGRVQTNARETCCEECGVVITEQELDRGREAPVYERERERTGPSRTVARHDRGLSTRIGRNRDGTGQSPSRRKRQHLHRLRREQSRPQTRSKRERNERPGLTDIRRMSSALGVPDSIRDRACSLFQTAQTEDLLQGRSIDSIAAASMYAACRLAGLPRRMEEVASYSSFSVSELRRRFSVLNVELSLSVPPLLPSDYVFRFASELDVPIDVAHVLSWSDYPEYRADFGNVLPLSKTHQQDLRSDIDTLTGEVQGLPDKRAEPESLADDVAAIEARTERKSSELSEKEAEYEELEAVEEEIERLEQEIDSLERDIDSTESNLETAKEELAAAEEAQKKCEANREGYRRYKEARERQDELEDQQAERDALVEKRDEQEDTIKEIRFGVDQLKEDLEELEACSGDVGGT